jgi:hypothetical protein
MTTTAIEASRQFMVAAEKVRPLYALSDTFNRLIDLIEDPQADQEALEAELAAVTRDIQTKAFGIAEIIRDRERLAADLKLEEDKLAVRRKRALGLVERLKEYALQEMHVMGLERLDFGVHALSVALNPPAVTVLDPAAVPHEYERTKITIDVDKRAILDHFRATGEIVPGVDITRGERLSID